MRPEKKPLVTVVGALSKQGRSVARTLLHSGHYQVRALTRHVNTPEAQKLAASGAELRSISLGIGQKPALTDAFAGSYGAFLMTPPIAPPQTHEARLGMEMADAAVEAGVQHVVFSTLENIDVISDGTKFAPHFTDKARVEEHIRSLPVRSSFVMLAFFYTNLLEYYTPRLHGSNLVFPIYLPENFRAPFVDPTSATGPAVLEIFSNPEKYTGATLPVIGDMITPAEMIDTFMRVTGRKAVYRSAFTRDGLLRYFPGFAENEPLVRELLGMAEYAVEYGYYRACRDLEWSRQANPQSLTWEQFLRATGWQGEPRPFGT